MYKETKILTMEKVRKIQKALAGGMNKTDVADLFDVSRTTVRRIADGTHFLLRKPAPEAKPEPKAAPEPEQKPTPKTEPKTVQKSELPYADTREYYEYKVDEKLGAVIKLLEKLIELMDFNRNN